MAAIVPSLTLLAPPTAEPLSREEAKAFLRLTDASEDALVSSLITTARQHVEAATGLTLMTQTWRIALDAWPADGVLRLPLAPLQSIAAIRTLAADGTPRALTLADFSADFAARPPRLLASALPLPGRRIAGIEIDVVAGFASVGAVPAPLVHALRLLVVHWFETRRPVSEATASPVPRSVDALLAPHKLPCP